MGGLRAARVFGPEPKVSILTKNLGRKALSPSPSRGRDRTDRLSVTEDTSLVVTRREFAVCVHYI